MRRRAQLEREERGEGEGKNWTTERKGCLKDGERVEGRKKGEKEQRRVGRDEEGKEGKEKGRGERERRKEKRDDGGKKWVKLGI